MNARLLQQEHLALEFRYAVHLRNSRRIIADLNDTRVKRQGISLSGGDPLHPQNVPEILKLVQRVRAECPARISGSGRDIRLTN
ncbi:anaerobic ribonucleotide reductase-activating protein [Cedecea neteri]|uniref:Anaerobic ribonucleotide reductase-activating protein n=1 Tax=Cedecea neteri TaxID=158822 RepID=A0A2X2TIN5_9ENTR|nr:anaerobic ribonucleotide reductase-activating protein [Cedecea neteri]